MRKLNILFLLFVLFFGSCTKPCTGSKKYFIEKHKNYLLFNSLDSKYILNLRFQTADICNFIYMDKLYQYNIRNNKLLELIRLDNINIDPFDSLISFSKDSEYRKLNDLATYNLNSIQKNLLSNYELINYWNLNNKLYLIVNLSTPKVKNNEIIALYTQFIVELDSNLDVVTCKPLIFGNLNPNFKGDIIIKDNFLYFTSNQIIHKDSLENYNQNLPSILYKVNIKNPSIFYNLHLPYPKLEYERAKLEMPLSEYPYYVYSHKACLGFNSSNDIFVSDYKNIFKVGQDLNQVTVDNYLTKEYEYISSITFNGFNLQNSPLLYSMISREKGAKHFKKFICVIDLSCKNENRIEYSIDEINKISNIAIIGNKFYFITEKNGQVLLNSYVVKNK